MKINYKILGSIPSPGEKNNALCMVLIRDNRGQPWNGKQDETSEDSIESKLQLCQIFIIGKIPKQLIYCKKCQIVWACLPWCYKTGLWNLYDCSVAPSTADENS